MKNKFCQVIISAVNKDEANKISDLLLSKKLISGSIILGGQSKYRWNGQLEEKEYYNVWAFSSIGNKAKIISEVEKIHSDKCPIIAFVRIDGNKKFLNWIKENVE